jgi:ABC-2 type transport system permease protein
MNWRAIRTLIRRDLQVVFQSKSVLLPMIVVPLILVIGMPLFFTFILRSLPPTDPDVNDIVELANQFPVDLLAEFANVPLMDQVLLYMLTYFFAPLFLILPLMTASVIAADSFAGEKERKTLEALIYTPTSDQELYVAKVLTPWVAAMGVMLLSLLGYSIIVNAVAAPAVGYIFFPNLMWIILAFWVGPAAAGLGLGVMVLVSSRVSTFQEAYQLGGLVVLPVLLLVFGQVGGILFFSVPVVLLIGLILWLVDLAVLWFGARTFTRSKLLSRL